jgi:CheY-like chemotaxis protein
MRSVPLILIADDDAGFQEIVATKLTRAGFLVAEAHNGREAVEKATNLRPDLILMDQEMPGESGTEAILDILENDEMKDAKIVYLTSMTDPFPGLKGETPKVAKEIGAKDFLNKSEDLDVIVDRVKGFLSRATTESTKT